MKIKVLTRREDDCTRERRCDLQKVHRNPDPVLHPFERAREYQRALNAVKLDRVFAKPFLHAMDGHSDGVFCMSKNPKRLNILASGACDGEFRVWQLSGRKCLLAVENAHAGFVRGLTWTADGARLLTCGDDKLVKLWCPRDSLFSGFCEADDAAAADQVSDGTEPLMTFLGKRGYNAIDHSWDKSGQFATVGGGGLDVWDTHHSKPVHSFSWGVDTIHCVKYNPAQSNILASAASDRSIALYDTRLQTPVRKIVLQMASNAMAWNPMEAFNFTVANEDHNLYSFDMRKLDQATCVHMDHVGAVLDIDYSPTGQEFVSGSYDRTLRIFPRSGLAGAGHAREIYHTRRMQRLFCVRYSMDAKYVISGSDDTNVRLWKAQAAEAIGMQLPREKQATQYKNQLKERFGHLKEIRRIAKHKHLPKVVKTMGYTKSIMKASIKRKDDNVRKHSTPMPYKPARKKKIMTVLE